MIKVDESSREALTISDTTVEAEDTLFESTQRGRANQHDCRNRAHKGGNTGVRPGRAALSEENYR